ncbi:mitochondrial import inner membrane translocase subunit TIM50 [Selaginella moellendorffii]|uniref:mitochondrial import inner membrane translocase subunit TIM50 n=1 Tax=Selaginella moellendorffii TaxID=88036 RepID=UPI000D1C9918|nr:mitochondrial import inner membrane translocase subunit TIM50 [Selaginella moellendorffii]|eukprot:XP_002990724.2 mitochondrial import inner membrane translocase subunit TIM50 [Selaginella moellendorffii]
MVRAWAAMWMIRLQRLASAREFQARSRLCAARSHSSTTFSTEEAIGAKAASGSSAPPEEIAQEVAKATASSGKQDGSFSEVEEMVAEVGSKASWRGIKALFGLTATAAIAGVSYVTYAYSYEDIERVVKPLRQQKPLITQDKPILERIQDLVYCTSCEVALAATDAYLDLRRSVEEQVKGFAAPSSDKLLPDLIPQEQHVYTIVLDLNETLVFSEWKRERGWGTFKRPGVEAFLEKLAHYYEIVVYSDQLSFYVDPILERLDQKGCIRYRLARDATNYLDGKHFRDLSKLNRDPKKIMYISGHALDTCLQPENAVPIKPWKLESDDTALLDLLPFLEFVARQRPPDVRTVLESYKGRDIATEFRERAKQNQRRVQERKQGQGKFWRGL